MIEKWIVSLGWEPEVKSSFGSKVLFNRRSIKASLKRDHEDGDSWIYEEKRGVSLYRWRIKRGRYKYDVLESDIDYKDCVVTIAEYNFTHNEFDLAVDCFIQLVKNPIKLRRHRLKLPPFILFR